MRFCDGNTLELRFSRTIARVTGRAVLAFTKFRAHSIGMAPRTIRIACNAIVAVWIAAAFLVFASIFFVAYSGDEVTWQHCHAEQCEYQPFTQPSMPVHGWIVTQLYPPIQAVAMETFMCVCQKSRFDARAAMCVVFFSRGGEKKLIIIINK